MADKEQIQQGWARLRAKWNAEGYCGSCSWHGLIYEHEVNDNDIAEALDGDGWIRLGCVGDYAYEGGHRGVKIFIGPQHRGSEVSETIISDLVMGTIELVPVQKVIGSRILMGGYTIRRDMRGLEISRTDTSWNGFIECWTEKEARRLSPNTSDVAKPR